MKPKVVILSAFLSPLRSGAEACAEEVPLALADRFDFTIITARMWRDLPKRTMLRGKIPVIRVGFGIKFDKWLFPFLAPLAVRRIKPDIIHGVLETFAGLALHHCRLLCPKAKRLLTLQTTNRSFLKKKIVRSPNRVTCISSVLQEIARSFGRNDLTVIPNGIDLAAIGNALQKAEKTPNSILFVGRLEPQKGIDTLLHAFAALDTDAHLRIVGDGSQRSSLESLARDLGIIEKVTFTGYVPSPDVNTEYAQAEIFCGLSRSEALGNVFLEAQAAGCAVVATNVHGIPDIVEDGRTGLLIQPDDAEAATETIKRLINNSALRSQLSENGKANAAQYGWPQIAERYALVYEELTTND